MNGNPTCVADYENIFKNLPGAYLLIRADDPDFTMIDATSAHLHNIGVKRENFIGKKLFEMFPDNPGEEGVGNLDRIRKTLREVISTKASVKSVLLRYDIPIFEGEGYDVRYWSLNYCPIIFNTEGKVDIILQEALDITDLVKRGFEIPEK